MTKKLIAAALLVTAVFCLFTACGPAAIDADEAWRIVQEDLGDDAATAGAPHIHEGTYNNKPCFNVFVTVNGEELAYIVSGTGEIIYKGAGSHNH